MYLSVIKKTLKEKYIHNDFKFKYLRDERWNIPEFKLKSGQFILHFYLRTYKYQFNSVLCTFIFTKKEDSFVS